MRNVLAPFDIYKPMLKNKLIVKWVNKIVCNAFSIFIYTNKPEIDMVIYFAMKWIIVDLLFYPGYLFVKIGKLTAISIIFNLVKKRINQKSINMTVEPMLYNLYTCQCDNALKNFYLKWRMENGSCIDVCTKLFNGVPVNLTVFF